MSVTAKIGDATSRIDGVDKVTGAARYAAEYFFDGMLYGWIVSSAVAKGRIANIDSRSPGSRTSSPTKTGPTCHCSTPAMATIWIRQVPHFARCTTTRYCSASSRWRLCWPIRLKRRVTRPAWS
jgi:hypothetical protein